MRLRVLLVTLGISIAALMNRTRLQAWASSSDPARASGQAAPELPVGLRTLTGEKISLASMRGHVVLLHFWTFACGNCEHMVPSYNAWQAKYPQLRIIGVHTPELEHERNLDSLRAVVRDKKINWTVVPDGDQLAWTTYGVRAWPTSFVIDKDGVIRGTFVGDDVAPEIERLLDKLLR